MGMTDGIKRIVAVGLSFVVLVVGICAADHVLKDRTDHGVKQALAMYEQPKDSIDVVMLGSSHVHYGINTAKLWEKYGISAYDYSSAEQPLWISYYYLKEICKTQKPKVVVLDFLSPAAFQEDYKHRYTHLSESFNGFRFNLNKLKMLCVSLDWQKDQWDKYFPAFFGYHDRYDDLTEEDFEDLKYDYANFKGFTPYFEKNPQVEPTFPDPTDVLAPSDKSIRYLEKIIEYTRKNDIKLYLTVIPYNIHWEHVTDVVQEDGERYNWLVQYVNALNEAGDDHVVFDYALRHYQDIGIDFESGEYTQDESHLNYYGATKFSDYLGGELRRLYGEELLPDHRGDPYYSSWDVNADELKKIVEENGFEWR